MPSPARRAGFWLSVCPAEFLRESWPAPRPCCRAPRSARTWSSVPISELRTGPGSAPPTSAGRRSTGSAAPRNAHLRGVDPHRRPVLPPGSDRVVPPVHDHQSSSCRCEAVISVMACMTIFGMSMTSSFPRMRPSARARPSARTPGGQKVSAAAWTAASVRKRDHGEFAGPLGELLRAQPGRPQPPSAASLRPARARSPNSSTAHLLQQRGQVRDRHPADRGPGHGRRADSRRQPPRPPATIGMIWPPIPSPPSASVYSMSSSASSSTSCIGAALIDHARKCAPPSPQPAPVTCERAGPPGRALPATAGFRGHPAVQPRGCWPRPAPDPALS